MEHNEYEEVVLEDTDVGGDDDVDQMNHYCTEQNMAREGTDMRDGDDVDQMNLCLMEWQERTLMWEVMMM
jgi:hypothetical protein